MHVQAHHVARSAREDQGVGAAFRDIAGIALHQAQVHHAFGDGFRGRQVRVPVRIARTELVHGGVETPQAQVVDELLLLREAFAHRHGRRQVARIVQRVLGAGIQQEHVPFPEGMDEAVVMEHLAVRRGDGREREAAARPAGGLLQDGRGDLRLVDTRAGHPVGDEVHPRGDVHRLFDGGDLLRRLVVAHPDDGLDEGHVGALRLRLRREAQQRLQPHLVVAPVRGQETDLAALQVLFQGRQRLRLLHAHEPGGLLQGRHRPGPDDIVDGKLVAEDDLLPVVNVDDGGKAGLVQAEEIQEGTVLAERVLVVMIVHAHELVPEEQKDTVAHLLGEAGAAGHIGIFVKHYRVLLFSLVHSFTNLCLEICWSVAGKYSARSSYRPGSRSLSSSRVFT